MFKKKQKESQNIIEFNLLEKAVNEKVSEIINTKVLNIIDIEIERLEKETDEEFKELNDLFKQSSPYLNASNKTKSNYEIRAAFNEKLDAYELFAMKVEAKKYLHTIRNNIYQSLADRVIKTKEAKSKW